MDEVSANVIAVVHINIYNMRQLVPSAFFVSALLPLAPVAPAPPTSPLRCSLGPGAAPGNARNITSNISSYIFHALSLCTVTCTWHNLTTAASQQRHCNMLSGWKCWCCDRGKLPAAGGGGVAMSLLREC